FVADAAVEDFRDVGMVHQRQGLALLFETLDDSPGIHSRLDEFESHAAFDRRNLRGDPHFTHAAFPNSLLQTVSVSDHLASCSLAGVSDGRGQRRRWSLRAFGSHYVRLWPG